MDGQIDERKDAQISPVFYRTSCPLRPLPCLLQYRCCNADGQGKGTADHILPLGNDKASKYSLVFVISMATPCLRDATLFPPVVRQFKPFSRN